MDMSIFWKVFPAETKHKLYLGLPTHMKLASVVIDIVFMLTIINQWTLLVLTYSLLAIAYSLLSIPYGVVVAQSGSAWAVG